MQAESSAKTRVDKQKTWEMDYQSDVPPKMVIISNQVVWTMNLSINNAGRCTVPSDIFCDGSDFGSLPILIILLFQSCFDGNPQLNW